MTSALHLVLKERLLFLSPFSIGVNSERKKIVSTREQVLSLKVALMKMVKLMLLMCTHVAVLQVRRGNRDN